jgi:hypothetical protein
MPLGCVAKKKSLLQSGTKRNEIRFTCVLQAQAKKTTKVSLLFDSKFSLPTKAKFIERIFALFGFQQFFVSLCFTSDFFVSLQSETK